MAWRDVTYWLEPFSDPRLLAVVNAISRTHANGGALLRCLRATTTEFDHAVNHDAQAIDHVVRTFLESESLRSLVPELGISLPIDPLPSVVEYSSWEFEGAVTGLLLASGAYVESSLSCQAARQIASSFADATLEDHRPRARVYRLTGPWCDWLCDVAWDASFAVLDPVGRRWWLLCVTDTD